MCELGKTIKVEKVENALVIPVDMTADAPKEPVLIPEREPALV